MRQLARGMRKWARPRRRARRSACGRMGRRITGGRRFARRTIAPGGGTRRMRAEERAGGRSTARTSRPPGPRGAQGARECAVEWQGPAGGIRRAEGLWPRRGAAARRGPGGTPGRRRASPLRGPAAGRAESGDSARRRARGSWARPTRRPGGLKAPAGRAPVRRRDGPGRRPIGRRRSGRPPAPSLPSRAAAHAREGGQKSPEWDLNPRPNAYEAFALPG